MDIRNKTRLFPLSPAEVRELLKNTKTHLLNASMQP
jgi:hypothetical protein